MIKAVVQTIVGLLNYLDQHNKNDYLVVQGRGFLTPYRNFTKCKEKRKYENCYFDFNDHQSCIYHLELLGEPQTWTKVKSAKPFTTQRLTDVGESRIKSAQDI